MRWSSASPNMASSSRNCVFDVAESLSLDNHANRCKRLLVVIVITYVQERVSALEEGDSSWILVDSGSAVTACPPTHAQEVPIIRGPGRVLGLPSRANHVLNIARGASLPQKTEATPLGLATAAGLDVPAVFAARQQGASKRWTETVTRPKSTQTGSCVKVRRTLRSGSARTGELTPDSIIADRDEQTFLPEYRGARNFTMGGIEHLMYLLIAVSDEKLTRGEDPEFGDMVDQLMWQLHVGRRVTDHPLPSRTLVWGCPTLRSHRLTTAMMVMASLRWPWPPPPCAFRDCVRFTTLASTVHHAAKGPLPVFWMGGAS